MRRISDSFAPPYITMDFSDKTFSKCLCRILANILWSSGAKEFGARGVPPGEHTLSHSRPLREALLPMLKVAQFDLVLTGKSDTV